MPVSRENAIEHFASLADKWSLTTIALCAAGAVVFLLGTHDEKPDGTDIEDELRKRVIGDRDVAQAQVYRYVGLAKALAVNLDKEFPDDDGEGPVHAVLHSRTAAGATKHIVDYLADQDIRTLDALADELGIYRRTPRKPRATRANEPPVIAEADEEEIADAAIGTPDPVHTLELIADRIVDLDVIRGMIQVLQARLEALTKPKARSVRRAGSRHPATA